MARRQRDPTKEQFWRRHLAAWRHSKLTVRDYCRDQGLAEPSFYAWRRNLTQRRCPTTTPDHPAEPAKLTPTDLAPTFLPVRLIDRSDLTSPVEILLRGGRLLRVTAGFSASTLRDLIALLEDLPC
jgi:hypothetical protein